MNFRSTRLPYRQTNSFANIALDYIDQVPAIKPFFAYPPTLSGLQQAIVERKKFKTDRKTLVSVLKKQYEGVVANEKTKQNIELLLSEHTFTITTAHQNNLFTGPLYFIYKIIHAIKLADHLTSSIPGNNFVPVFYIGSEDADLEELDHIHLGGEKIKWDTKQTGAVGRMKIDKALVALIDRIEGQLTVLPDGKFIVDLLRKSYQEGTTIQDATFHFVNELFSEYGLVILLPDNAELKRIMHPVFEDDLKNQRASAIVEKTAATLEEAGYKIQANPREINLFYLQDNVRERIEKKNGEYSILNIQPSKPETEIMQELKDHPERFSPNVILRGIYQETILPNIAFIGGAGETAYWLQLKDLFEYYKVPFPVLVLRNSFLLVEKKSQEKIRHLGFTIEDFFQSAQELLKNWISRESKNKTKLNGSLSELERLYDVFRNQAAAVDSTLEKHVEALKAKTLYRLHELEKKMLRAEKRKYTDQERQISTIKRSLFPGNGLQERKENISYYIAKWGHGIISELYDASPALEQEFTIILENGD
jgi:bacillithiol biosynthesis cysteine-adding enzyme BshC